MSRDTTTNQGKEGRRIEAPLLRLKTMAPIIVTFFDGWWQVLFVLAGSQPIALLLKGFMKKTILVIQKGFMS